MAAMGQGFSILDCRASDDPPAIDRTFMARPCETRRRAILTRTVEFEVIPRLLRARRPASVTPAHVAELVELTLGPVEPATSGFVEVMRHQGFRAESLYLDLLSPAAVRLGDMWVEDLCDFTDVTIGLNRLQGAMRVLSPSFLGPAFLAGAELGARRAILVPLPGEQHTFGLAMVHEFFRRAGWSAWSGPIASAAELATMLRTEWFDVLGFSLSCDERLDSVPRQIRAVRQASRNPALAVMVGGPPFTLDPTLVAAVGADGTARDALEAVAQAESLVEERRRRQA